MYGVTGMLYMEINRLYEHVWHNNSIHCMRAYLKTF